MSIVRPSVAEPSAERRWVLVFAALVALLTSLPYLVGFYAQGDEWVFTGFVFGVEDGNSYIAKMLSGAFGAWKFVSPYSAYPQTGVWIYPLYIWLGKLAAPPGLHEQLVALFHMLRLGAVFLAVLATYDFLAFFIRDLRWRRFGLALATLGGGLGWLLVLLNRQVWLGALPLEFYSPEAFGFLSLYGIPHLALARALLLWALLGYLRMVDAPFEDDKGHFRRSTVRLSFLWILIGLAQPLTMLVLGALLCWHLFALAIWQLVRRARGHEADWQRWRRLAGIVIAAGVLPGIFVLYNAWLSFSDPYVRAWTAQNLIRSPHPLHYLLAYGLLIPYAVWGGRGLLRERPWTGWLPVSWVALFPLLAYAPLDLQRRLTEGVWVAWVILALAAFGGLAASGRVVWRRWAVAPMWLAFPSTALLLIGGLLTASKPNMPLFRPQDEVAVFLFLQSRAEPGEVALTAYDSGNALPAWAPVKVVIGHGPESVALQTLSPQVAAFYAAETSDNLRLALIRQFNVRYVLWGPHERALGGWSPEQAAYLQQLYQSGEYHLYEAGVVP
jgi:hypothetical protein